MQFYLTTDEAWNAMYAECEKAQHSIDLEQYIIWNDPLGERFLRLLAAKAREGVKVRLILDGIGSRRVRSSPLVAALRGAGAEVRFYRPLWWIQALFPACWFPRDHCKLLVVDGAIMYLGGVCIAGFMQGWRDTQVRITGEPIKPAAEDFACFWSRIGNRSKSACPALTPPEETVRYVVQQPHAGKNPVYRELLEEIGKAQDFIYLATPYFFPPRKLREALMAARHRGVEVTIMLSERTDVPLADKACRVLLKHWLHRKFCVLFYRSTVLHAKYAVVDGRWATVGSTNFDYLSLRYNREANLILRDRETVATLERHFLSDRQHCVQASVEDWRNQPWQDKVIGRFGVALQRFL